jgi:hypothetical protein
MRWRCLIDTSVAIGFNLDASVNSGLICIKQISLNERRVFGCNQQHADACFVSDSCNI